MSVVSHTVRASLTSKERTYRLEPDEAVWSDAQSKGSVGYANISKIHLIHTPFEGNEIRQCTIRCADGTKLTVTALHYTGLNNPEDRTATYAPFVRELTGRVAAGNPNAEFVAGSNMQWYLALFMLVIGSALAAILAFSAVIEQNFDLSVLAPLAFVCAMLPMMWQYVKRGRGQHFAPNSPPPNLIGDSPAQ